MRIYNIFHYAVDNFQEKDYKWNSRSNEEAGNKLQKWHGLNKTLNLWKINASKPNKSDSMRNVQILKNL